MKSILLYMGLFWITSLTTQGQVLMNKDSLLRLLPAAREDTNKVILYINIGQQYEGNDPETAKAYYRKSRDLSQKIGYKLGEIRFITNYTFVLNMQGRFDSSIQLNLRSVELARQINNTEYLAKCLFNTGTAYQYAGMYDSAIVQYEEGKKVFALLKNEMLEARSKDILQILYMELHRYDKAIELGESAIAYFRNTNDKYTLALSLSNTGLSYVNIGKLDKAVSYFRESLALGKEIGDLQIETTSMLNLGDCLIQTNKYNELQPYFKRALELSQKMGARESEAIANRGLAIYYLWKNDLPLAKKHMDQAIEITAHSGQRVQHRRNLETLSNVLFAMHRVQEAEEALRTSTILGDSLNGELIQQTTLQLEKKYESERKDNQIRLQQASIRQKTTLNYMLIGGAVALLLISFLLYLNYRHKQRLQVQRIQELETEKQLMATEAVLKGEEQERSRLAKDLHDGLGGMLSGIKYSLNTMKGNQIMTPENQQAFERSMDMLDSSIKEMRRVAHNMMPEALLKFGLDTALRDFCNDINQSGALSVTYQSFGMEGVQWEQSTAITIYRIVQELLNNTMKHAAARTAIVQVGHTAEGTSITVEDDGKGFDPLILKGARGIGWTNIQSRISYLKGRWDVQSEPGKGTSIHIEINS
ncbi:MAG: tetratricopeptide repeat protein [Chitinophagaceae bacterium]|nr:tetratricopeptide repeat protein [Chitinophagaceae bacterium]